MAEHKQKPPKEPGKPSEGKGWHATIVRARHMYRVTRIDGGQNEGGVAGGGAGENTGSEVEAQYAAAIHEYREGLTKSYESQSDAYDKAVMTLSGGALGISMTFIKDLVPSPLARTMWMLGTAWFSFGVSVLAILISNYTSQLALKTAIKQVDEGVEGERPGRWAGSLTARLNVIAGLGFALGVGFLVAFALKNLSAVSHGAAFPK